MFRVYKLSTKNISTIVITDDPHFSEIKKHLYSQDATCELLGKAETVEEAEKLFIKDEEFIFSFTRRIYTKR